MSTKNHGQAHIQSEIALVLGLVALQAVILHSFLTGETTITHDNLLWNYPVFLGYFENISKGVIPIYNFMSRFGEPFLPLAVHMRFVDPVETLLGSVLWRVFSDKLIAYNLFRYFLSFLQTIGVYLFLRTYTQALWVRGVLLLSMLFGSMFLGNFLQDGVLNQFLWTPFILLFLRRRFWGKVPTPLDWLAVSAMLALSFLSYWFLFPSLFIFLFVALHMAAGQRIGFVRSKWMRVMAVLCFIAPLVSMGALNLFIFERGREWIYPARADAIEEGNTESLIFSPKRLKFSLEHLNSLKTTAGAVHSEPWDYIQMFSPSANRRVNATLPANTVPFLPYRDASEAYIYFGMIPLVLGFIGLAVFRSREGWAWLNLMLIFILLGLGPEAIPYRVLVRVAPLFAFARNTHCVVMFVEFCFLYFLVVGGEYVERRIAQLAK